MLCDIVGNGGIKVSVECFILVLRGGFPFGFLPMHVRTSLRALPHVPTCARFCMQSPTRMCMCSVDREYSRLRTHAGGGGGGGGKFIQS